MKIRMTYLLVVFVACCSPEDAIPTKAIDIDNFDTTNAILLKQGDLQGINHTASGKASLYDSNGTKVVVLDPYESQNGPDLKVYLSKDADANSYIRLGQLKSITGRQSYAVPGGIDPTQYHYVHVWCEKYTVVFARAEIK